MKQVKIEVYRYDELSDEARRRARMDYEASCGTDNWYYEFERLKEVVAELLEKRGLELLGDVEVNDGRVHFGYALKHDRDYALYEDCFEEAQAYWDAQMEYINSDEFLEEAVAEDWFFKDGRFYKE